MQLSEAIRTTGSARSFTAESVDDALVYELLADARFAPSGGNRQPWRVAVIKDPAQRQLIGNAMRPVWDEYVSQRATGATPFSVYNTGLSAPPLHRPGSTPSDLIDGIVAVPVVLVVAVDLTMVSMMDHELDRVPITGGGSVYPFCWNVLLAARSRGLGGVMTTFLSRAERDIAESLGLPERYALAATIFLGHAVHQPTRLKRYAVEEFATVDRFDGIQFRG